MIRPSSGDHNFRSFLLPNCTVTNTVNSYANWHTLFTLRGVTAAAAARTAVQTLPAHEDGQTGKHEDHAPPRRCVANVRGSRQTQRLGQDQVRLGARNTGRRITESSRVGDTLLVRLNAAYKWRSRARACQVHSAAERP